MVHKDCTLQHCPACPNRNWKDHNAVASLRGTHSRLTATIRWCRNSLKEILVKSPNLQSKNLKIAPHIISWSKAITLKQVKTKNYKTVFCKPNGTAGIQKETATWITKTRVFQCAPPRQSEPMYTVLLCVPALYMCRANHWPNSLYRKLTHHYKHRKPILPSLPYDNSFQAVRRRTVLHRNHELELKIPRKVVLRCSSKRLMNELTTEPFDKDFFLARLCEVWSQ